MLFTVYLDNEEEMLFLARKMALLLKRGDLIALSGDLGTGKSTYVRAIIRTLAKDEDLEVPSPTFTLLQSYENQSLPATHVDLYRIKKPEEVFELNLEQAQEDGILLVEWPEKAGNLLLKNVHFFISIKYKKKGRNLTIRAESNSLLQQLQTAWLAYQTK